MELEIYRRTDTIIAHHPNMRGFLHARAEKIGARARMLLDTRSEVRTGKSHIVVSSGKLDAYVTLVDVPPGTATPDKIAAIISRQHTILTDAMRGG